MSGGSSQAPMAYQPSNQAGQDASYNAGTGLLSSAGANLYGAAAPAYAGITQATMNNPYYATAQQGANQVAALGPGVSANQAGMSQSLMGLGAQAPGIADQAQAGVPYAQPTLAGDLSQGSALQSQAQSLIPAATSGMNVAPGVYRDVPGSGEPRQ